MEKNFIMTLKKQNIEFPVLLIGGRLNENVAGSDLPVDVSEKLSELGINVDNNMYKIVDCLVYELSDK